MDKSCAYCDQGDCENCHGTGVVTSYSGVDVDCNDCCGSGVCEECGGSGSDIYASDKEKN